MIKRLRIPPKDVLKAVGKPPDIFRPWTVISLDDLEEERSNLWIELGFGHHPHATSAALFHAVEYDQLGVILIFGWMASNDLVAAVEAFAPKAFVTWMGGYPLITAGSDDEREAIMAWCEANVSW